MSENHRSEISITLTGVGYSDFYLGDEITIAFEDDLRFVDGNISTTFRYRIVGIGWTSEGDSVELQLRKKVEGQ